MRITGKLLTECPECHGVGYTPATAAEMHAHCEDPDLEQFTVYRDNVPQLGSGCPRCLGTGQL